MSVLLGGEPGYTLGSVQTGLIGNLLVAGLVWRRAGRKALPGRKCSTCMRKRIGERTKECGKVWNAPLKNIWLLDGVWPAIPLLLTRFLLLTGELVPVPHKS
jgi:hypothetical protein